MRKTSLLTRRGSLGGAVALAAALAFGVLASPHAARADAFDVRITDYAFTPATITVHVGDPVTWTNDAGRNHTVTSDSGDDEIDSGDIGPGEAFGHVFEAAGTYAYHCSIHPDRMHGKVTVLAATPAPSTNATPEPTPPTGTLPPNFSPFPSLGPAETAPTESVLSSPIASAAPAPTSGGDSGTAFAAIILVALLVLVGGVAAYGMRRRSSGR